MSIKIFEPLAMINDPRITPSPERDRGNGLETQPGIEPKRGCSPKPPRNNRNPRTSGRGGGQPRKALVKVVTEDAESREVLTDIIISPIADEPLISDMLAEELEIAVESFGRGLWRFRWEGKLRRSERKY
jgi:hypothetical protein